ncbi:hypothetical protein GDO86_014108, partial [Hymenochirus boettgeri]
EEETLTIRESMDKSDQLTNNMVAILSSFESRLMKLENSIIPVHKQTETLQRLQENVDRALSCLDHVISYYHVATETERVIREGPSGRLEGYLGCIAKIQKAVEYFQDNNPDSPELNRVKSLFERGKESLEFCSLLQRQGKPVPPILILDLIGTEEEMVGQEETVLEHLPEGILQDVIRISNWLVEYGRNQDFMNVYYQIRSSQLDRSIKGLKDHLRKNSSSSGITYSPAVQNKRKDTPTKKAPKRPGQLYCFLHPLPMKSDNQLLMHIITEHHQKKTFDSLIQIFPILRHLKLTKPEFDKVLQGTAASTKNKLPSLITSIETTGAKALEDFADSIKNDPDKETNMSKDGTVHELTSNAILFLQQLLEFQETAGAMLASQVLGDTYNIPIDPRETSFTASSYSSEFNRHLLSTYICKVLGNLQLKLLSKSKMHEDLALGAIFLHNNYNYILKSLEKSELMQLVSVTQKHPGSLYQEHIEQQIQTYQRSWLKVTDYVNDRNMPTDKERQMIKERFKGFNDGLEEICKIQKSWAIPDKRQRERIHLAQKSIVQEAYATFLHM